MAERQSRKAFAGMTALESPSFIYLMRLCIWTWSQYAVNRYVYFVDFNPSSIKRGAFSDWSNLLSVNIIILILWIPGAAAIAYGMMKDNDQVFLLGIAAVSIGYLIFRKRLAKHKDKKNKKA